jgi:hypothetical protein
MAIQNATISEPFVNVGWLFFADFADLPIRGAFAPCPLAVPIGLADADEYCAGFTFDPMNSDVLQVSSVTHQDGGADTLAFTLHADPNDAALLTAIENTALYAGRLVLVWSVVWVDGVVTEIKGRYLGYMTQPGQQADANSFTITMESENALSVFSTAQNRTYMNSKLYDAGDNAGAVIKGSNGAAPGIIGGGRFVDFDAREMER